MNLYGKKVLFICPSFFEYQNKIIEELSRQGAIVTYYDERYSKKPAHLFLSKYLSILTGPFRMKYYNQILDKHSYFDLVIFIKGSQIPCSTLAKFEKKYNDAQFILYLWDSIKNAKIDIRKFNFFDSIYTFDRKDSLNNPSLRFLPLFYDTTIEISKIEYDLCFIGTVHSNRYKYLAKIRNEADRLGLKIYYYLYFRNKYFFYLNKIFNHKYRSATIKEFSFKKMPSKMVIDIVSKSKVIIDYNHPNQSGLTIRTIEALANGKKLITTNEDIVNYKFYSNENIFLLNDENVNLSLDFFKNSYRKINDFNMEDFHISNWVKSILEGIDENTTSK